MDFWMLQISAILLGGLRHSSSEQASPDRSLTHDAPERETEYPITGEHDDVDEEDFEDYDYPDEQESELHNSDDVAFNKTLASTKHSADLLANLKQNDSNSSGEDTENVHDSEMFLEPTAQIFEEPAREDLKVTSRSSGHESHGTFPEPTFVLSETGDVRRAGTDTADASGTGTDTGDISQRGTDIKDTSETGTEVPRNGISPADADGPHVGLSRVDAAEPTDHDVTSPPNYSPVGRSTSVQIGARINTESQRSDQEAPGELPPCPRNSQKVVGQSEDSGGHITNNKKKENPDKLYKEAPGLESQEPELGQPDFVNEPYLINLGQARAHGYSGSPRHVARSKNYLGHNRNGLEDTDGIVVVADRKTSSQGQAGVIVHLTPQGNDRDPGISTGTKNDNRKLDDLPDVTGHDTVHDHLNVKSHDMSITRKSVATHLGQPFSPSASSKLITSLFTVVQSPDNVIPPESLLPSPTSYSSARNDNIKDLMVTTKMTADIRVMAASLTLEDDLLTTDSRGSLISPSEVRADQLYSQTSTRYQPSFQQFSPSSDQTILSAQISSLTPSYHSLGFVSTDNGDEAASIKQGKTDENTDPDMTIYRSPHLVSTPAHARTSLLWWSTRVITLSPTPSFFIFTSVSSQTELMSTTATAVDTTSYHQTTVMATPASTGERNNKKTTSLSQPDIHPLTPDDKTCDDLFKPDWPPSFLELRLAMSWYDFCQQESYIRDELVDILRSRDPQLHITIDQIQLMSKDLETCPPERLTERDEVLVLIYLLNKTRHLDIPLTLVCANILLSHLPEADNAVFKNKLVAVRIYDKDNLELGVGASVKGEDREDNSSPFQDPGVTIAVVMSTVGGCYCLGLLVLQVILRQRRAGRKVFSPNSSIASSDSIQLSSAIKSRPNSGFINSGFELADPVEPSNPLSYDQLTMFCLDESNIFEEYQKIPLRNPRLSVVPPGDEDKNRYANVLPWIHNQVKLQQDVFEPRSTYINANYVTGPGNKSRYYIATQAPTEKTTADFWAMVWQQNVGVIVMLTELVEKGQVMCASYWPELTGQSAAHKHGDFLIELTHKDVRQEYIVSRLVINNLREIATRQVDHFLYTCWPSVGVPEPISLVKLVLDTRPKYEGGSSPLLVHCSPGTGRTCTFIALDLCMRQFEEEHVVNVSRTVNQIRQERAGAVQNKEQYLLLYNALTEYAAIVVSPVPSASSSATSLLAFLPS